VVRAEVGDEVETEAAAHREKRVGPSLMGAATGAPVPRCKQESPRRPPCRLLCLCRRLPRGGREVEGGNPSRCVPCRQLPARLALRWRLTSFLPPPDSRSMQVSPVCRSQPVEEEGLLGSRFELRDETLAGCLCDAFRGADQEMTTRRFIHLCLSLCAHNAVAAHRRRQPTGAAAGSDCSRVLRSMTSLPHRALFLGVVFPEAFL